MIVGRFGPNKVSYPTRLRAPSHGAMAVKERDSLTIEVPVPCVPLQHRQRLRRQRTQIRQRDILFRMPHRPHPRNHARDRGVRQTKPQRQIRQAVFQTQAKDFL